MGYEVKLHIGTVHQGSLYFHTDEEGNHLRDEKGELVTSKANWFNVFATIDMCKIGSCCNLSKLMQKNTSEEIYYFFADDGNTQITEDRYNEKFIPVPLEKVVKALRKDMKNDEYRRFKWAYQLCNSMLKSDQEPKYVFFYGH